MDHPPNKMLKVLAAPHTALEEKADSDVFIQRQTIRVVGIVPLEHRLDNRLVHCETYAGPEHQGGSMSRKFHAPPPKQGGGPYRRV